MTKVEKLRIRRTFRELIFISMTQLRGIVFVSIEISVTAASSHFHRDFLQLSRSFVSTRKEYRSGRAFLMLTCLSSGCISLRTFNLRSKLLAEHSKHRRYNAAFILYVSSSVFSSFFFVFFHPPPLPPRFSFSWTLKRTDDCDIRSLNLIEDP